MKKKLDFVTNSSSCSFVAWGISIDIDKLKEKYGRNIFEIYKRKQDETKHKKVMKQGAFMTVPSEDSKEKIEEEYNEFIDNDDFSWEIESCLGGLEVQHMPYEDEIMIGKSPFSIKEEQSLKEFKQEICDQFKTIGMDIKPNELGQIEECWMDN